MQATSAKFTLGLCGLASAIVAGCDPGACQAQSLTDVFRAAYANSPLLKAERAALRVTGEKIPEALAATRPTIAIDASEGAVHERTNIPPTALSNVPGASTTTNLPRASYGLTVTQPLYRGGQTLAQFREAKAAVSAERSHLAQVESDVLLHAGVAYIDLVQYEALFDLAQEKIETAAGDVRQAQERLEQKSATRRDVAQFASALEDATGDRAKALADLQKARAAFLRDTGVPIASHPTLPKIASTRLPTSESDAVLAASQRAPTVLIAVFNVEVAEQEVRRVAGQAKPSLSLQGLLQHQEGTDFPRERNDVQAATVQLHVPLYSGGAYSAETRAARSTMSQKNFELEEARRDASYSASEAWGSVAAARTAVEAFRAQVESNQTALQGARLQAQAGEITTQDVKLAEQSLVQSKTKLIQSEHDEVEQDLNLLAAIGDLTIETIEDVGR